MALKLVDDKRTNLVLPTAAFKQTIFNSVKGAFLQGFQHCSRYTVIQYFQMTLEDFKRT